MSQVDEQTLFNVIANYTSLHPTITIKKGRKTATIFWLGKTPEETILNTIQEQLNTLGEVKPYHLKSCDLASFILFF